MKEILKLPPKIIIELNSDWCAECFYSPSWNKSYDFFFKYFFSWWNPVDSSSLIEEVPKYTICCHIRNLIEAWELGRLFGHRNLWLTQSWTSPHIGCWDLLPPTEKATGPVPNKADLGKFRGAFPNPSLCSLAVYASWLHTLPGTHPGPIDISASLHGTVSTTYGYHAFSEDSP